MNKKKPDLVVWNEITGYDANIKEYPTNVGSVTFTLPNISLVKTEGMKKMLNVFDNERNELIVKIEKYINEFNDTIMVWESKISFEPVMGHIYYLYESKDGKFLSLIAPNEWNKYEEFVGAYKLTAENKWIKQNI